MCRRTKNGDIQHNVFLPGLNIYAIVKSNAHLVSLSTGTVTQPRNRFFLSQSFLPMLERALVTCFEASEITGTELQVLVPILIQGCNQRWCMVWCYGFASLHL